MVSFEFVSGLSYFDVSDGDGSVQDAHEGVPAHLWSVYLKVIIRNQEFRDESMKFVQSGQSLVTSG